MLRDLKGEIIPLGKTERKIEETFLGISELPSWLTVTGNGIGTPSHRIVGIEADYGFFELKTGNVGNSSAILNILPNGINMTEIQEVVIELDSLTFSDGTNVDFYFQFFTSGNEGVALRSRFDDKAGETFLDILRGGVSTKIRIPQYPIISINEYKRRRNISLRIRRDKTVVLSEGDIVVFEYQLAHEQFGWAQVYFPKLTLIARGNSDRWLRFSRIGATVIHN